ncbi:hypothetical protein BDR04DRAFT_1121111 [Suillus decipiens]|nr:hypothetical protein BDR04DRAFT_1121111 [Suillus decipiens]
MGKYIFQDQSIDQAVSMYYHTIPTYGPTVGIRYMLPPAHLFISRKCTLIYYTTHYGPTVGITYTLDMGPLDVIRYMLVMGPPVYIRTIEDGIKLASLMSIPVNDVATLNKMTTIELNCLVTSEPQSLANGLQGHLLPLIFKPFTVNIPQAHTLRIKPDIEKFTHEEIFSSFLHTLSTAMAESKKKLIILSATCTWSVSNSMVAVSSSNIKCKPDLVLSNNVKPKWGNICPAHWIVKAADIDIQAYLLLSNQPWRCFVLILSFTHQYCKLRVLLYDHAGGVVTPRVPIHQNPNTFAQIIATVVFGNPECIRVLPFLQNMTELLANYVADSILPSDDDFKPISPADYAPKLIPNDNLESLGDPIEELPVLPPSPALPPPLHIPLQPLAVTSAPLLALASQSPLQGPEATFSSTPHSSHFPHTPQSPAEDPLYHQGPCWLWNHLLSV